MREIGTYLIFNGNCAEAMRFYEKTLGGKLESLMTHGDSPMAAEVPPEHRDKILHARLVLDSGVIMASDAPDEHAPEGMDGFSISVSYDTAAEGKRIFEALSKAGKVNLPYDRTFWAEGFGMLVDRFGTPWFVSGGEAKA
jgi:PhnB protein